MINDIYEKILSDETYKIIGACMEVHRELGCGFLEAVYQEALEKEFILRKIPFVRESKINIKYKSVVLEKSYFADFICYEEVIIELKAISCLDGTHTAQIVNYLKATDLEIGLLVNFGQKSLQQKRVLNSFRTNSQRDYADYTD